MGYLGKYLAEKRPWHNFAGWTVMTMLIVVFILLETSILEGVCIAVLGLLWLSCVAIESWKQSYRNKYKKEPELSRKQIIAFRTIHIAFCAFLLIGLFFLYFELFNE